MRSLKTLAPDRVASLVLALFAFLIYVLTLSPAVNTLDGGELAASAATLGVAHPTGYPLFLLVSRAFMLLIPFGTVIWKLNLLMAVFGATSIFFFHRVILKLLTRPGLQGNAPAVIPVHLVAAAATLVLAFTKTYWMQAIAYEVYSFQALLLGMMLWLYFSALHQSGARGERLWALFALTLGLSFTNHMTTVVLLPALLYYHFAIHGLKATAMRFVKAFPVVLVGVTLYLYLPIRASVRPLMNWGDPSTVENFFWHVQGKQFWRLMFDSGELAMWKLRLFVEAFPTEFGYLPPLLALPGLFYLAKRDLKLFVFTLLLAAGSIFYAINYGITDIESYFIQAYVAVVIWIAFGIYALLGFIRRRIASPAAFRVAAVLPLLPFLFPLIAHYRAVDLRGMYAAQDYTRNVLETAEPGGVIFTDTDGRHTIAFYLQLVEGVRPDVVVIDRGWIEFPFYAAQLKQRFPWLREELKLETDLGPEFNKPYRLETVAYALRELMANNIHARAFYFTYNFRADFFPGFLNIPTGLAFRLFPEAGGQGVAPPAGPVRAFTYRPIPHATDDTREVENYYALAYLNQGSYRLWLGEPEAGIFFLRQAIALRPDFPPAQNLLNQALAEQVSGTTQTPGSSL